MNTNNLINWIETLEIIDLKDLERILIGATHGYSQDNDPTAEVTLELLYTVRGQIEQREKR